MPQGPNKGRTVPLAALLDDFYSSAGWELGEGHPELSTLSRLGIKEFVDKYA